jgi:hypothetical protein
LANNAAPRRFPSFLERRRDLPRHFSLDRHSPAWRVAKLVQRAGSETGAPSASSIHPGVLFLSDFGDSPERGMKNPDCSPIDPQL